MDPTRPDELKMTPKVDFNIVHVAKFILKDVKSCKHDTHEMNA